MLASTQAKSAAPPSAVPTGWSAQIVKTGDGGKTWDSQFSANGTFYFNEVDCAPGELDASARVRVLARVHSRLRCNHVTLEVLHGVLATFCVSFHAGCTWTCDAMMTYTCPQ